MLFEEPIESVIELMGQEIEFPSFSLEVLLGQETEKLIAEFQVMQDSSSQTFIFRTAEALFNENTTIVNGRKELTEKSFKLETNTFSFGFLTNGIGIHDGTGWVTFKANLTTIIEV